MEQRDINSRTRADTFGLRPDLYDALAGNMVKKDDVEALIPFSGELTTMSGDYVNGSGFLSFTEPVGTLRGCHKYEGGDGGIVIDEVGQWRIDTTILCRNSQAVVFDTEVRIEVFDSSGVFLQRRTFSQKVAAYASTRITVFCKFVISEPGHRIRVYGVAPNQCTWSSKDGSTLSAEYKYPGV